MWPTWPTWLMWPIAAPAQRRRPSPSPSHNRKKQQEKEEGGRRKEEGEEVGSLCIPFVFTVRHALIPLCPNAWRWITARGTRFSRHCGHHLTPHTSLGIASPVSARCSHPRLDGLDMPGPLGSSRINRHIPPTSIFLHPSLCFAFHKTLVFACAWRFLLSCSALRSLCLLPGIASPRCVALMCNS